MWSGEGGCNFRYCGQGRLLGDDFGGKTCRLEGEPSQGTKCSRQDRKQKRVGVGVTRRLEQWGEERAVEMRSEVRGWCRMAWDLDPCKDFSIDLE